jgi:hypothetical protein
MLQKGFLREKYKLDISLKRFVLSVVIGLIAAISIYAFLCGLRLVFRTFEFSYSNGALIFDKKTRYWQNFNLSIIALVIGNSLFISSLFRAPQKSILRNYKRRTILVDQYFLGFNFFYLFLKLFFLFGLFFMQYSDFQFLSSNFLFFFLLGLVIFLESYKTIMGVFRMKAFFKMLINLCILIGLTFALATTSIFSYKEIDKNLLTKNPKVDLPESNFTSNLTANTRNKIFVKVFEKDSELVFYIGDRFISTKELPLLLMQLGGVPYHHGWATCYILFDNSLHISKVKEVEKLFSISQKYKIVYVTKREEPQFTSRFEIRGIYKQLAMLTEKEYQELNSPSPPPPFPPEIDLSNKRVVEVVIENNKETLIGKKSFSNKEKMINEFRQMINTRTVFNFVYEDDLTYQNYITVFAAHRQAVNELREFYFQMEEPIFGPKEEREKYDKEKLRVWRKFPIMQLDNFQQ